MIDKFLTLYHTNLKTDIEKILFPIFFIIFIFNFVPSMFGYNQSVSSDDSNPADHDIQLKNSLQVHMALSSSITCMLPLLLDFLFDYFYYNEIFRVKNDQHITSLNRNIIIILLLIPDIFLLFIGIPYELFDFMYCFCNARDILLTIYFLKILIDNGNHIWNEWSYVFIALPSAINNLLLSFTIIIDDDNTVNTIMLITRVLSAISMLILIMKTIQITNKFKFKIHDITTTSPTENVICLVQTYLFLTFFMIDWFVNLFPSGYIPYRWLNVLGTNFLTMYTCSITLSFTVNYFIGYQLQRIESFQTKVSNLVIIFINMIITIKSSLLF